MDEHMMLVPNTMATSLAATTTKKSTTSKLVTAALAMCLGGALFALGVASSSAFHTADVAVTMSSIQSDAMEALVANERPFRLRLPGLSNLCVDGKDAMVSLAPCDIKATSQVFKYDKIGKSLVITGTNECFGYDANKNIKPERCSSPSAHNMVFTPAPGKFLIYKPSKLCLDNVAGETAGVPLSLTGIVCDDTKRSQEFDILTAIGTRLAPLEKYPETTSEFNIALMGSGPNCFGVAGAAISCKGEAAAKSRRFFYDVSKKQFFATVGANAPVCVTAGQKETKPCANDNANQVFVYEYARAMFRGRIDNVNLCSVYTNRNEFMLLGWCDNNTKLLN